MYKFTKTLSIIIISALVMISFDSSAQNRGRGNNGGAHRTENSGKARSNSKSGNKQKFRDNKRNNSTVKSDQNRRGNNNSGKKDYDKGQSNHNDKRHGNIGKATGHNNRPGDKNQGKHHGNVGKPNQHNNKHGHKNHDKHHGNVGKPGAHPHHNYKHKHYHPPHPKHGHCPPPPTNCYRWHRRLPPPPPAHYHVRAGIPVIDVVFGISFGTFIDYSITLLVNSGYNVIGYDNNVAYLSNVNQYGYMWPEAQIYYTDGLMSTVELQYWSITPDMSRYNNLFTQLCRIYGSPANRSYYNNFCSASWWGGNKRGYLTLQYEYGNINSGYGAFYTTLTYGNY